MKEIPLNNGMSALVDDEDYSRLAAFRWTAIRGHSTFYAMRQCKIDGKWTTIQMHRAVLRVDSPQIDHYDGNGLNNQKLNLRPADNRQNQGNTKRRSDKQEWIQRRVTGKRKRQMEGTNNGPRQKYQHWEIRG